MTLIPRLFVIILVLLASIVQISCSAPKPNSLKLDASFYSKALADREQFRKNVMESCASIERLDSIIDQAVAIGAPIYNAGSPLGCYRIYEGAAYKMLFLINQSCKSASSLLQSGLAQAVSEPDISNKAWVLRNTFDTLQGVGTSYQNNESPARPKRDDDILVLRGF